jgi:hypothetical protein
MRPKRILTRDAWYEVRTVINNREPLFRRRQAIAIFCRVFGEALRLRASGGCPCGRTAVALYQTGGRVAASGDHAVAEADICGAVQSGYRENRPCLGRPVLVVGAGRGAA